MPTGRSMTEPHARKFYLFRRRHGIVYLAMVHHPIRCDHLNGQCYPTVGYVGESVRSAKARWHEHVYGAPQWGKPPAPWADTIIEWEIIREWDQTWDWWRLWREYQEIQQLRPLYNEKRNYTNPRRITKGKAREQRALRDAGLCPNVTAPVRSTIPDTGRPFRGQPEGRVRRLPDGSIEWSGRFFEREWSDRDMDSLRFVMRHDIQGNSRWRYHCETEGCTAVDILKNRRLPKKPRCENCGCEMTEKSPH